MSATAEPAPIGLWRSLVFSLGAVPVQMLAVAVLVYLPNHLTTELGMPLAVVGVAWTAVRLLDIGVDPLLGLVMDRTRTRFGRYRPWLAAGVPITMLASGMLFFAPPGIGPGYLIAWLVAVYVGVSILALSHTAWSATLAPGYDDRSRLNAVIGVVCTVAAAAILLTPSLTPQANEAQAITVMGWMIVVGTPLLTACTVFGLRETVNPDLRREAISWQDWRGILGKPDLVRLALSLVSLTLGPVWMSSLYLFFARDYLGLPQAQASILLVIFGGAGLLGAPLAAALAIRIGKHRALIATSLVFAGGILTFLVTPKGSVLGNAPTVLLCGVAATGFAQIGLTMLVDVADEVRLEQGRERLSLLLAVNPMAAKLASAFAIGLTFPLLQQLGYDPKAAANTPEAVANLVAIFIGGPVVFVVLGAACVIGWKLTPQRHAEIRAELARREAGGAPPEPSAAAALQPRLELP